MSAFVSKQKPPADVESYDGALINQPGTYIVAWEGDDLPDWLSDADVLNIPGQEFRCPHCRKEL